MLGLISKSFKLLEPEMASKLYKALVRPIPEYSNPVWGLLLFWTKEKLKMCNTELLDLFHLLEATPIQRDWQC